MKTEESNFDDIIGLCRTAAINMNLTDPNAFDTIIAHLDGAGITINRKLTRKVQAVSPNTIAVIETPDSDLYAIQWDGGDFFHMTYYEEGVRIVDLYSESKALELYKDDDVALALADLEQLRYVVRGGRKHYEREDVHVLRDRKLKDLQQKQEEARLLTLRLPEEFLERCRDCNTDPAVVLRGFIADLCGLQSGGYITNGSDERDLASRYFRRCGYGEC
jgi:hypothetical protein